MRVCVQRVEIAPGMTTVSQVVEALGAVLRVPAYCIQLFPLPEWPVGGAMPTADNVRDAAAGDQVSSIALIGALNLMHIYAARLGAPLPAAGGTGTATLTFEDLLVEGGMRATDIAPEVVECANLRYSGAIVNAIMQHKPELAMEAYKLASMLPSTATVAELHAEGYMFSERPQVPDEGSVLTLCYKDERVYLIKPLRVDEAARAHTFQAAVAGAPVPHVTPFELVDTARGKHFMILPKYALTLEPLPYLSPAGVTMLWTHMAAALEGLHGRGFVHADVKPSNICLNAAGSGTTAILIDLGSVVRVGTATPSTPTYVPHDLRAPGNNRGSVALDWWMLAVTLADKACGRDHGLLIPVGGVSMAEVRSHLAAHLDPAVWAALAPRLVEEA